MDIKQGQQNTNSNPNDELNRRRQQNSSQQRQPRDIDFKISGKMIGGIIVLIIVLVLLSNSLYIVKQNEVATVKQFSDITQVIVDVNNKDAVEQNKLDSAFSNVEVVNDKGLFFKVPFITTVDIDTSKLITYIAPLAQVNTQDKIKYEINMFAQWEISHPGLFRSTLGTEIGASSYLDEIAYAKVIETVNSLDSDAFLTDKDLLTAALEQDVIELNEDLAARGIIVKDLEIYRTLLPNSNIESTYSKMIAEREAIAQQKLSEGLEIYNNTVADTDREVIEINSAAIEESETIRGEADATALEIYADGFGKDPEFYEFWRSMNAYENVINEDTTIYLNSDNDFLKFFSTGG